MAKPALALLVSALLNAAAPPAADQAAIQEVFQRYLRAYNDCSEADMRAVVATDFSGGTDLGRHASLRLRPNSTVCADKGAFEISGLARSVRSASPEVATAFGFFRTMHRQGGERAGRVYVTFVKRESRWQIMDLSLQSLLFERPFVEVSPATWHDPDGADGWTELFNGQSAGAFLDAAGSAFPERSWRVGDGALQAIGGAPTRGLRTRDTYRNFELRFEWKAGPKGNSGIKYHLFFLFDGTQGSDATGHEYQIADDAGDPGAIRFPVERSGALYNQIAPRNAAPKALGEFNQSSILVQGRHREHWLNGAKVVEYESESSPPEGPLVIQHHGTDMWFRNIRVRRLD